MITEPMKAPRRPLLDFATLQMPVFASFKEDGIRCLTHPTFGPISRSFKPIRNEFIRNGLAEYCPNFLDGEIVTFDDEGKIKSFNDVQSDVMTIEGYPNYQYRVFDWWGEPDLPFLFRRGRAKKSLHEHYEDNGFETIVLIEQKRCDTPEEVQRFYDEAAARGKEGIIVRSLVAPYKSGRVTEREGYMYKCVALEREDAMIVGYEQLMKNCNVAKADEFGRSKRSKEQAGMVPMPMLGAFIVENHWGTFKVSGFTQKEREEYWQRRNEFVGPEPTYLTYKYKPHGSLHAPRTPIFVGFRHKDDL